MQQMMSFRDRMKVADEALAKQAPPKDSPEADPWYAPTSRLKGKIDWEGMETIQSREVLDALGVPVHAKRAALYRRLNRVMQSHGWRPIRVKLNGINGGGVTERVRGYERQSGKLPVQVAQDHPGKIDTSSAYVMSHVVARLEQDSRWALARSVRSLVAERDLLREQLEGGR
jgi:hypothetical protein